MDYEKLYKQAEQRAIRTSLGGFLDAVPVKEIFPELIESEDDKMRKALIIGLNDCMEAEDLGWSDFGGMPIEDLLDWLEKQNRQILANSAKTCKDEQKLSNLESIGKDWSEEDETMLNNAIEAFYYNFDDKVNIERWLKSIKERLKEE